MPDLLGAAGLAEAERLAKLQRAALEGRLARPWFDFPPDVPEAGPYICTPLSGHGKDEDAVVAELLENKGSLFHPGKLYGLPGDHLIGTVFNCS